MKDSSIIVGIVTFCVLYFGIGMNFDVTQYDAGEGILVVMASTLLFLLSAAVGWLAAHLAEDMK